MNYEGDVVPLFRNFHELMREEAEVLQKYASGHAAAFARYYAILSLLGDDNPHASFVDTDLSFAKVHLDRHGSHARFKAMEDVVNALTELATERDAALFGIGKLAKRTQRFASSVSRTYTGPASSVVSMEGRRRG